ncbi:hypothetical protein U1Q18_030387 [Sarracenia purpurea var. burkii]
MASGEDHTVYGEEDLDDDDDEESEEDLIPSSIPDLDDDVDDDVDEEEEDDDDSSSSNLAAGGLPASASAVTVAVSGVPNGETAASNQCGGVTVAYSLPDPKRQRIEDVTVAAVVEEKKPIAALDDSRRLFQRLWTDEDEIELLQGFLDYTTQRGTNSSHHHDTTAFYDQIKSKLQLDFNKNQLVEKLRRLKKKYRNVVTKIDSGKEFVFKSLHDQATFEISRKIWSGDAGRAGASGGGGEEEDEESTPNPNPNPNPNLNSFDHNYNGVDIHSSDKKLSRPRKRSRVVKIEEKQQQSHQNLQQQSHQNSTPPVTSIPNLIEETVRSCLSPLFKELLHNSTNNPFGLRGYGGVAALNPVPFSFGSHPALNFTRGDMTDERWRKQHILELEVYSKRLELVQDQIKLALEELKSMGS